MRVCLLVTNGRNCIWRHDVIRRQTTDGKAACRVVGFGMKQQQRLEEGRQMKTFSCSTSDWLLSKEGDPCTKLQ